MYIVKHVFFMLNWCAAKKKKYCYLTGILAYRLIRFTVISSASLSVGCGYGYVNACFEAGFASHNTSRSRVHLRFWSGHKCLFSLRIAVAVAVAVAVASFA